MLSAETRKTVRIALAECETIEDVRQISRMARDRWDALAKERVRQFSPGQRVKWTSKRGGDDRKGTVTHLNKKTVGVRSDTHGDWRIPPGQLTLIEEVGE